MNRRNTEITRVKEFINIHKTMKKDGWLNELIVSSGVLELYEDKYRKLMFEIGTSKHPHPEERL